MLCIDRPPRFYLGADVGATKTHLLIADGTGQVAGFGQAGPGNHEVVGYEGLSGALQEALRSACPDGFSIDQIAGAGFGVGGYDFPSERDDTLRAIVSLGVQAPIEAVNDTIIGLLAGSSTGWGVAVVSGTGCNCWGWDQSRQRVGRVTGHGLSMGEGAGASELVERAIQTVVYEWAQRGPATRLTTAFLRITGASSLAELVEGLVTGRYSLDASNAPLVFEVAGQGDPVAIDLIHWAGRELGELASCVIRQLGFENQEFEVVLVGGMFDGGPMLIEPMRRTILSFAPGACLVRLTDLPVIGAVLLGMEAAGNTPSTQFHQSLSRSLAKFLQAYPNRFA
jgi:N-acetylglucosamine kinase-like BadF-type ATPase